MDFEGIPEYFQDATIFITGGTGFMGKALIEKVLRSCPGVKEIYLLMRPKRGSDLQERMEKLCNDLVFDRLKTDCPGHLSQKLKTVTGDIRELGLGLSQEDRKILVEKVNIVIHLAATVRFDQPMKDAVIMNTRGTREVCELALEIKQIKMMMHVSTAYCQLDKKVIEERMYPRQADWRKTIAVAEHFDKDTLNVLAPIYMEKFPNTYTFTKSLAEDVVYDMLNGKVPNIIFRPTIVTSSLKEPEPGWINNFNGPMGLCVATSTGLIRINYVRDVDANFLPVDVAIRSMLIAAWYEGTRSPLETRENTEVYNCAAPIPTTWNELIDCTDQLDQYPLGLNIWYASKKRTGNLKIFYVYFMLFNLIPALIIDCFLKLTNRKPKAFDLQKKFYTATSALVHFTSNSWTFKNDRLLSIESQLLKKDLDFKSYANVISFREYFQLCQVGTKKFLIKGDMNNLQKERARLRKLYWLDQFVKFASYFTFFYFVFYKYNILGLLADSFINYYDNLLQIKL